MTANKNNNDFSDVNLRRERLQADLDKDYTKTVTVTASATTEVWDKAVDKYTFISEYNEEIEKAMDALRNLQGDEEHVNVLFEKQQESAKETGKPHSPENVKKVINEFYKNGEKLIYRGAFWSNMGVSFWNHGPTHFDEPIKGMSVVIKCAEQIISAVNKEGLGLSKDQVIEHKVKGTKTIYGNIYVDEFPDESEQPFDVTLTTWCPICNKFYHAKLYGICRTSATDYVARAWVPWKEGRP